MSYSYRKPEWRKGERLRAHRCRYSKCEECGIEWQADQGYGLCKYCIEKKRGQYKYFSPKELCIKEFIDVYMCALTWDDVFAYYKPLLCPFWLGGKVDSTSLYNMASRLRAALIELPYKPRVRNQDMKEASEYFHTNYKKS